MTWTEWLIALGDHLWWGRGPGADRGWRARPDSGRVADGRRPGCCRGGRYGARGPTSATCGRTRGWGPRPAGGPGGAARWSTSGRTARGRPGGSAPATGGARLGPVGAPDGRRDGTIRRADGAAGPALSRSRPAAPPGGGPTERGPEGQQRPQTGGRPGQAGSRPDRGPPPRRGVPGQDDCAARAVRARADRPPDSATGGGWWTRDPHRAGETSERGETTCQR